MSAADPFPPRQSRGQEIQAPRQLGRLC
jgi:hypothetical protein